MELVEVHYCCAVGGHARGQTDDQRRTLEDRLSYLEAIYTDPKGPPQTEPLLSTLR